MPTLKCARIQELANADPEFRLHSRSWDVTLRFDVDDEAHVMKVSGGVVSEFDRVIGEYPAEVVIGAPFEEWDELLQPVPRPFWHDLMAASSRQGFVIDGADLDRDFRPYYPAVRRLIEIMRDSRREG